MSQPGGSPGGQAGVAVDGAELARRMMMATEAASAATEMAARALEELKAASDRSSENRDWYKLLAKPASFDPSSREAEIAGWKDWSCALEQYLGSLDAVSQKRFESLETIVVQWLTQQLSAMLGCVVVLSCMGCWLHF